MEPQPSVQPNYNYFLIHNHCSCPYRLVLTMQLQVRHYHNSPSTTRPAHTSTTTNAAATKSYIATIAIMSPMTTATIAFGYPLLLR
jgi:hypothetical protein